ncbi:MAG: methylmalonyl-CoA mutase family protein [Rhodothermales bacterium]
MRGALYDETLVWQPWDGFAVAPYYRAEDLADVRFSSLPPMPSGASWHVRQDFVQRDLGEANRLAREALRGGAEALGFSLSVDGEARRGVPIQSADDFHRLLDDIDLGVVPLHFEVDSAPQTVGAMWADVARQQGVAVERLQGSLLVDRREGWAPSDVQVAADEAATLVRWATDKVPRLRVLGVDVRPYSHANPAEQIGKALAQVSDYLAHLAERDLRADQVAGQMHLAVSVGASFLMEIAKLRALRQLAARVVSVYAEEENNTIHLPITAYTSPFTSDKEGVHLNLVQGTAAAAAAVLGGCDALVVQPFDVALGPPTDTAYRLARGTQLILRHEAHLGTVADPTAGAYYLEVLTDKLARAAWDVFRGEEGKEERKNGGKEERR